MPTLNKTILVKDLEEVLLVNLKKMKKGISETEGDLREIFNKVRMTDSFIDVGGSRRPNPAHAELVREQYDLTEKRNHMIENKKDIEKALKRIDELGANREGQRYLEDAEIEVTLSQMVKWGISEEDVK